MDSVLMLFSALAVGFFWLDSTRAHETALGICQTVCAQAEVQLLDHTVALHRLGVRWPRQGVCLRRVYRFDFSEEGVDRRTGYLVMLDRDVQEISLGHSHTVPI